MRRIATLILIGVAVAGVVVARAGADDNRTYQAELFNAFGLVEGSELRVAGVKAGTVTDLDITPQKTALVTFEVGSDFPELKADASCSSEPQSLIAEYFLDCQPGSSDQEIEGPIPASRNQTTVQNDLVQATLSEPYKRRFQLIINEFGTALVGNPENLNAAIRSGAPALRELRKVLKILGRQNRIITELNVNNDIIFQKLADRREDVVRFINDAEHAARVSAERRDDLSRNFDLLDDFLFELKPVMVQLGNLAREQTPLLTDLKAAAPGLNLLATNLPRFNNATRVSLKSLGRASVVGRRALAKSTDEIAQLNQTSKKAYPASNVVAKFLESIDDPKNAVEEDCDAREDLRQQPGEAEPPRQAAGREAGRRPDGQQGLPECRAGGERDREPRLHRPRGIAQLRLRPDALAEPLRQQPGSRPPLHDRRDQRRERRGWRVRWVQRRARLSEGRRVRPGEDNKRPSGGPLRRRARRHTAGHQLPAAPSPLRPLRLSRRQHQPRPV